jgi:hypothetical protein
VFCSSDHFKLLISDHLKPVKQENIKALFNTSYLHSALTIAFSSSIVKYSLLFSITFGLVTSVAGLESIIFFFTASFRQALNLLKYDDTDDDDKGCPLVFFAVFLR